MSPKLEPTEEELRALEANEILHGFIKDPGRAKKKETKQISNAAWANAVREVHRMLDGEVPWNEASSLEFVALYAILHLKIYGVEAIELGPTERLHATGAAGRLKKKEFDDRGDDFVKYMKWAWIREEGRERWRRDHNRDGGRLGWKLMFNGSLLTDYRVSIKRHG
jgi:hypothetical protein